MTDGQLPFELRRAIEQEINGVRFHDLRTAASRVSDDYRCGRLSPNDRRAWSELDRLAYVAVRMPATYAAIRAVLGEVSHRRPDLAVRSLLDLGSGPGTGLWAATNTFTSVACATHVEVDRSMNEIARRLLAETTVGARVQSTWQHGDASKQYQVSPHDLALVAYLLGEVSPDARNQIVDAAWVVATGALVIVEPGTPAGFRCVLAARSRLVEQGATIIAPCPHDRLCPLPDDDWCHFGARLNRSSVHRNIKQATLAYEDEKYSYVIAVRVPRSGAEARVIRRPQFQTGRVFIELCSADGLARQTVSRSERESYRRARKLHWGDIWDR